VIKIAQLFFRYSTMGAGKSLEIFRIADNYQRQNKKVLCFVPEIVGEIKSRVGIATPSTVVKKDTNIIKIVQDNLPIHCLLIDEAQFLNKRQVMQLIVIVDTYGIPVICYGLKNDFKNELFEGSKYLLLYAVKQHVISAIGKLQ
jgi:thymidine kinase